MRTLRDASPELLARELADAGFRDEAAEVRARGPKRPQPAPDARGRRRTVVQIVCGAGAVLLVVAGMVYTASEPVAGVPPGVGARDAAIEDATSD